MAGLELIEGFGTRESPLVADLIAVDSLPVSGALKARGNYLPTPRPIAFSTYYDRAYATQEKAAVWDKAWQFVCREEDIPNVGDRYAYDVGSQSFVIVRSGAESFHAFFNACLHRGTRLCSGEAGGDDIRCPFHGWRWTLEGRLKEIPGRWDFPQVDDGFVLPEVQVGRWGGCLFINPDPGAGSLDDALGVLKSHFAHFDLADRFTLVRTAKKVRANWKTVWAAFLESYHVAETHFDAVSFSGDANTQYDCFEKGGVVISRLITPSAVPSPTLNDRLSAREAAVEALKSFASALGPAAEAAMPDFESVPDFGRRHVAAWRRGIMSSMIGADCSTVSDSEMIDSIQYAMFPNFGPWLGEGLPLMYQFIPYGDDPNESLFTVRLMAPLPAGGQRPPCAPMTHLDFDEPFTSLPQWGRVANIFDQDMANLPNIQRGMRSAAAERSTLTLGRYQEQRIALLHEYVDQQIARHRP